MPKVDQIILCDNLQFHLKFVSISLNVYLKREIRGMWRHFLGRFQIENVSNSSHQFLNTSNHFVNGTETSFNSVPSNFVWSSEGLTYPKSPRPDDKDANVNVDEDEDETKDFLSDKYASMSEGSA